jgi:hypothetical protein
MRLYWRFCRNIVAGSFNSLLQCCDRISNTIPLAYVINVVKEPKLEDLLNAEELKVERLKRTQAEKEYSVRDNLIKKQQEEVQEIKSAMRQQEIEWKQKLKAMEEDFAHQKQLLQSQVTKYSEEIAQKEAQIAHMEETSRHIQKQAQDQLIQSEDEKKQKMAEMLKRIDEELEKKRRQRQLEQEEIEHKWKVVSYSDTLIEQFIKQKEEEARTIVEHLKSYRKQKLEELTTLVEVGRLYWRWNEIVLEILSQHCSQ